MKYILLIPAFLTAFAVFSQTEDPIMDFEAYNPESTLVVPGEEITKAKFPFIDIHNHQFGMPDMDLNTLIVEMDKINMAVLVNLSGRGFIRVGDSYDLNTQEYLKRAVENGDQNFPGRFAVFTNISFANFGEEGWTKEAVRQLEEDVKNGAKGLKIYKSLGLRYNDQDGNRVAIDDPRIDPVWAKCGELGIPVLIHAADPKPFWDEHDENNERWLELKVRPGRKRSDSDPAPWETIIAEQHRVFKKHPNTIFINAHLGWYGNNLGKLGELLDEMPNMYTEIGAVIAELGRQPRNAKKFLTQYQDRVLFGKDSWKPQEYHTYFRVLESDDEYFPYYKKYHAFWRMYGLDLEDEVLKKIYYKNALKIVPGLDASQFPE